VSALSARETINLYATLGDMKEVAYKNALAINALTELLIAKGLITRDEITTALRRLDAAGQ
jgi:hypothetical protein